MFKIFTSAALAVMTATAAYSMEDITDDTPLGVTGATLRGEIGESSCTIPLSGTDMSRGTISIMGSNILTPGDLTLNNDTTLTSSSIPLPETDIGSRTISLSNHNLSMVEAGTTTSGE